MQVAATGAAFLLIHRSVLKAMSDRSFNEAFPFFQETQNGPDPVGEDLTFCLRLASLGIPVHVHTGVKIGTTSPRHHRGHVPRRPPAPGGHRCHCRLKAGWSRSPTWRTTCTAPSRRRTTRPRRPLVDFATALVWDVVGFDVTGDDYTIEANDLQIVKGHCAAHRGAVVHQP